MKNTKGITLIALIITIIIMLILVAVSISVALNTGLFKSAGDATKNWKSAQDAEANAGSEIEIDGQKYSSINEYIKNMNSKIKLSYSTKYNRITVTAEYEGEILELEDFVKAKIAGQDKEQIVLDDANYMNEQNGVPKLETIEDLYKELGVENWDGFVEKIGNGDELEALKVVLQRQYNEFINESMCFSITLPDGTIKVNQNAPMEPFSVAYIAAKDGEYEFTARISNDEKSVKVPIKIQTEGIYYHPEQDITKKDIGIGTDGKPVNLNLWDYEIINGNEIHLGIQPGQTIYPSYKNENIVNGKIIGTVPQYIYINGEGEPYVVTDMTSAFSGCTDMIEAPVIPDTVYSLFWTFSNCTSLSIPPIIPPSVTNLNNTFVWCSNLKVSPSLPESIRYMSKTFSECINLEEAPVIPDGVEVMYETFRGCTSLKTAPAIPKSVTSMSRTFYKCTKLQGTIRIDADPTEYDYCFSDAATEGTGLVVTGSSSILDKIIKTGDTSKITRGE